MALSCLLGKFSHAVVPRAVRAIASPIISHKYFSTEINLESGDQIIPRIPANFPFYKINSKRSIRLKRRIAYEETGEKFYVDVRDKRVSRDDFFLTVLSTRKLVDEGLHQKFRFVVDPCEDAMVITSMCLDENHYWKGETKNYGYYTLNEKSDLQVALREFIKVRGFDLPIGEFMYDCCNRTVSLSEIFDFPRRPFRSPANIEHINLVDQKLIGILDSEINSPTRSESEIQVPQLPPDFPFKIEDVPGNSKIILTREFGGEKIVIKVVEPCNTVYSENPFYETPDDNADNSSTESSGDDEEKEDGTPEVQLRVKISEENGKTLKFKLLAKADYIDDHIDIDDDQEVDFSKSKSKLDGDWIKYLEIRGIKNSIGGFLLDYMDRKFKRDHLILLRKLKKHLEYKDEEVEEIRGV